MCLALPLCARNKSHWLGISELTANITHRRLEIIFIWIIPPNSSPWYIFHSLICQPELTHLYTGLGKSPCPAIHTFISWAFGSNIGILAVWEVDNRNRSWRSFSYVGQLEGQVPVSPSLLYKRTGPISWWRLCCATSLGDSQQCHSRRCLWCWPCPLWTSYSLSFAKTPILIFLVGDLLQYQDWESAKNLGIKSVF